MVSGMLPLPLVGATEDEAVADAVVETEVAVVVVEDGMCTL